MKSTHALLLAGVLAMVAAGCGDTDGGAAPSLPPPTTAPLPSLDLAATRTVSCGDAYFYLIWPDGEAMLTVVVPELATRAVEADAMVAESYAFGDPGVDVLLRTGEHLDQDACNDAIEFTSVTDSEERPVAGRISVTANPAPGGVAGDLFSIATLTLDDLTFPGIALTPATLELTDLQIGWYVG